jgi:hypothetical protein
LLWCGNAANNQLEDKSSGLSNPATDDEHGAKDGGFWRLITECLYVLLKNNVVTMKKVNKNARKAAKTM